MRSAAERSAAKEGEVPDPPAAGTSEPCGCWAPGTCSATNKLVSTRPTVVNLRMYPPNDNVYCDECMSSSMINRSAQVCQLRGPAGKASSCRVILTSDLSLRP